MKTYRLSSLLLISIALFGRPQLSKSGGNCDVTSVGFIPLTELAGTGIYYNDDPVLGVGGLYPGDTNIIPEAHRQEGLALVSQLEPLDDEGNPDPVNGKIGIVTLGYSNMNNFTNTMLELLGSRHADKVVIANCSQGGRDAHAWDELSDLGWTATVPTRLQSANLDPNQVQIALQCHVYQRAQYPGLGWPDSPMDLQTDMEEIARRSNEVFKNLKLSWWIGRSYGGYVAGQNNPTPHPYESWLAIRWMMEKQINGDPDLSHAEKSDGTRTAAWIDVAPYFWADGLIPRIDDGLIWECDDYNSDGAHESQRGRHKYAAMLLEFLHTHEMIGPWFNPPGNIPPMCGIAWPGHNLETPQRPTILLEATAIDTDDGVERVDFYLDNVLLGSDFTFPYSFPANGLAPGTYVARVEALDTTGNSSISVNNTIQVVSNVVLPGSTICADNFESSDFNGGSGWTSVSWTLTGSPSVTSGQNPPEGSYQARLDLNDAITRGTDLSGAGQPTLSFQWRGMLPAQGAFMVEASDDGGAGWISLLSESGPQTVQAPQRPEIDLGTFGLDLASEPLLLRFRVQSQGAQQSVALLDQIQILSPVGTTSFPVWIAGHGLSASDALELANPDNDDFTNLEEYAFDLDPSLPEGAKENGLEASILTDANGEQFLTFTYTIDYRKPDITIAPQQSPTLGGSPPWTIHGITNKLIEPATQSNPAETYSAQVPVQPWSRAFMRLSITRNTGSSGPIGS